MGYCTEMRKKCNGTSKQIGLNLEVVQVTWNLHYLFIFLFISHAGTSTLMYMDSFVDTPVAINVPVEMVYEMIGEREW